MKQKYKQYIAGAAIILLIATYSYTRLGANSNIFSLDTVTVEKSSIYIPQTQSVKSISCPTSKECFAIATVGNGQYTLLTSKAPITSKSIWNISKLPVVAGQREGPPVNEVQCPSANLCFAILKYSLYFSRTPLVSSSWMQANSIDLPSGSILSCSSTKLCFLAASGSNGNTIYKLKNPVNVQSFEPVTIKSLGLVTGLSCLDATECLAVDASGDIYSSTNLTSNNAIWNKIATYPSEQFMGLSCAGIYSCLAPVGQNKIDEIRLSGSKPSISVSTTFLDSLPNMLGHFYCNDGCNMYISCTSRTICLAADPLGNMFWINIDSTGKVTIVTNPVSVDATVFNSIYSLQNPCPQCAIASTVPQSGSNLDYLIDPVTGISCQLNQFCMMFGTKDYEGARNNDTTFVSNDVASTASWSRLPDGQDNPSISTIYCNPTNQCVAIDTYGNVFKIDNYDSSTSHWEQLNSKVDQQDNLFCVSDLTVCMMPSSTGFVYSSSMNSDNVNWKSYTFQFSAKDASSSYLIKHLPLTPNNKLYCNNNLDCIWDETLSFYVTFSFHSGMISNVKQVSINVPKSINTFKQILFTNSMSCFNDSCIVVGDGGIIERLSNIFSKSPTTNSYLVLAKRLTLTFGKAYTTYNPNLDSVSCLSINSCIILDANNEIIQYRYVLHSLNVYHMNLTNYTNEQGYNGLSCVSNNLCISTLKNIVYLLHNPYSSNPGWTNLNIGSQDINDFSCQTTSCNFVTNTGKSVVAKF